MIESVILFLSAVIICLIQLHRAYEFSGLKEALQNPRQAIGTLGVWCMFGGSIGAMAVAITGESCRNYFALLAFGAALRMIYIDWMNWSKK